MKKTTILIPPKLGQQVIEKIVNFERLSYGTLNGSGLIVMNSNKDYTLGSYTVRD